MWTTSFGYDLAGRKFAQTKGRRGTSLAVLEQLGLLRVQDRSILLRFLTSEVFPRLGLSDGEGRLRVQPRERCYTSERRCDWAHKRKCFCLLVPMD